LKYYLKKLPIAFDRDIKTSASATKGLNAMTEYEDGARKTYC
jgi:hypothetical protein